MHLAGLSPQNRCSGGAARGDASAAASSKTKIQVRNGPQNDDDCSRKACKTIIPSDARSRRSFRGESGVPEDDAPVRPVRSALYSNDDDHGGDEDGSALRNVRFHPE
jgi:hypothetical protein